MTGRSNRLGRVLAIRQLNKDLSRRALELALTSVAEVEAGLARQEAELSDSRKAGRVALIQGDRPEWLMADAQAEVAGWNRQGLQKLLDARTEAAAHALRDYLESRSEHEQVMQLVEDAQRLDIIREGRRAQLSADDWFLSRREPPDD